MATVQRIWAVLAKQQRSALAKRRLRRNRLAWVGILAASIGLSGTGIAHGQGPKKSPNSGNQNQVQDKSKPTAPSGTPQAALNIFADAANFQNNAAYDLAIAEWKKLIEKYPKDAIVSKAHHYLGVCYLRLDPPAYADASKAFEAALQDKALEVREETLFNLGWCQFIQGRDAKDGQKELLTKARDTLQSYLKSYSDGSVADRALFYLAESEYLLGERERAAEYYKQLTQSATYSKSSIRPDALYAMGVNFEELKKELQAKEAFDDFLKAYPDHKLANEVKLLRAEIALRAGDTSDAVRMFKQVADSQNVTNLDYVLYRYGFALAKAGDFAGSSSVYKRLSTEFPKSQYSTAGILAAGQTLMREKRFAEAAEYFKRLLPAKDERAAEAAHWLCQIELLQNRPTAAVPLAREALKWAGKSPSEALLRMDLAEGLMEAAETRQEAKELFVGIAKDFPKESVTPRATYNAAFLAMQLGQPQEAKSWAEAFLKQYPKDSLLSDAQYVLGESHLMLGEHAQSVRAFEKLVQDSSDETMLPVYRLRLATVRFLQGSTDQAMSQLQKDLPSFKQPVHQAEAHFLLGACSLRLEKWKDSIAQLKKANEIAPKWNKADETQWMLGQVYQEDDQVDVATATFESLIKEFPNSRFRQQAEYRLGQIAVGKEQYDRAIQYYDGILQSKAPSVSLEYVSYAKAFALMQQQKYEDAIALVAPIANSDRNDNLAVESRMIQGVCSRNVKRYDESIRAFQKVIDAKPEGDTLPNALYEQGLALTQRGDVEKAKANFNRIRKEFPSFKGMDKVIYEGAWLSKDANEAEAVALFRELSERFPESPLAGEANFHIGQTQYADGKFDAAIKAYTVSAKISGDVGIQEKSLHKLGWAYFKLQQYAKASEQFEKHLKAFPKGELVIDGTFMRAQCAYMEERFDDAFSMFSKSRQLLETQKDTAGVSNTIKAMIYLRGAQSARELKKWEVAQSWLQEAQSKFPESTYLPEITYELANCYQNLQKTAKSLELFEDVANKNRNEIGARARFMMGEVYFSQKEFAKAIQEFQKVMYGFGAQQAAEPIKNWQARSAVEAGRCAELLIGDLQGERRGKAIQIARGFYQYVLDQHPEHEFASQAKTRIGALEKM